MKQKKQTKTISMQDQRIVRGNNMLENILLTETVYEVIQLVRWWNQFTVRDQPTARDKPEEIERAVRNRILDFGLTDLPESKDLRDWQEWLIDRKKKHPKPKTKTQEQDQEISKTDKHGFNLPQYTQPKGLKEWVEIFGLCRNTLSKYFKEQKIRNEKVGRKFRVLVEDLPGDKVKKVMDTEYQ